MIMTPIHFQMYVSSDSKQSTGLHGNEMNSLQLL